jgi:hypothetical protein
MNFTIMSNKKIFNLQGIFNKIDNLKHSHSFSKDAANILETFSIDEIGAFLKDILDNEELLVKIAQKSYYHPNGFYKILLNLDPENSLRLHVWDSERYTSNIENVHNHCFDFASRILVGSLHSLYFREVDHEDDADRKGLYHSTFEASSRFNPARIKPVGRSHMKIERTVIYKTGETYAQQKDIIHQVPQLKERVATLLIGGNRTPNSHSDIYSLKPIVTDENGEKQYKSVMVDELKEILSSVILDI